MSRPKNKRNTRRARRARQEHEGRVRQRQLHDQYLQFTRPACIHCQSREHLGIDCPNRPNRTTSSYLGSVDHQEWLDTLRALWGAYDRDSSSFFPARSELLSTEEKERQQHAMKYL